MEGMGFEKKKCFKVGMGEWTSDEWHRMVMMTLVRWDDRGGEMNQEEADQQVADEVSEEVDARGELLRSEKNDFWLLGGLGWWASKSNNRRGSSITWSL